MLKIIGLLLFVFGGLGDLVEREPAKGYVTAFTGRMNSLLDHARSLGAESVFTSLGAFCLKWAGLVFFTGIALAFVPFDPIKLIAFALLYLGIFAAFFATLVPYAIDWRSAARKDLKEWGTWLMPIGPISVTILLSSSPSPEGKAAWREWSQVISVSSSHDLTFWPAIGLSLVWGTVLLTVGIVSSRLLALIVVYPPLLALKGVSKLLNLIHRWITPNLLKAVVFLASGVLLLWD